MTTLLSKIPLDKQFQIVVKWPKTSTRRHLWAVDLLDYWEELQVNYICLVFLHKTTDRIIEGQGTISSLCRARLGRKARQHMMFGLPNMPDRPGSWLPHLRLETKLPVWIGYSHCFMTHHPNSTKLDLIKSSLYFEDIKNHFSSRKYIFILKIMYYNLKNKIYDYYKKIEILFMIMKKWINYSGSKFQCKPSPKCCHFTPKMIRSAYKISKARTKLTIIFYKFVILLTRMLLELY